MLSWWLGTKNKYKNKKSGQKIQTRCFCIRLAICWSHVRLIVQCTRYGRVHGKDVPSVVTYPFIKNT